MPKNFYYTCDIADKIRDILNEQLSQDIKNITVGTLQLLPPPEVISDYIPAVFIDPIMVDSDSANDNLEIEAEIYPYSIVYVSPYSYENYEDMRVRIKEAEGIANVLRQSPDLKNFTIDTSDTEAGGRVLYVKVCSIRFDNTSTELFHMIKVPACVIEIQLQVLFRTFSK